MRCYIIVTEGITDCSIVEGILEKELNFLRYDNTRELPPIFQELVGRYPTSIGELKTNDTPNFFRRGQLGVCVKRANGCTKIANTICDITEIFAKQSYNDNLEAFLVLVDTDIYTKEQLAAKYKVDFRDSDLTYEGQLLTNEIGQSYMCKFCFTPEKGSGAIESVLLECSKSIFGDLYNLSADFRPGLFEEKFSDLRRECWCSTGERQQFYADKAQFGFISAVLSPDKSIRHSIKDKIVRTATMPSLKEVPEFKRIVIFFEENLI